MNKLNKMLNDKDASANIAVKNLEVSKKFYEDTLGLTQVGAEGGTASLQEWKYHNLCISVPERRNQPGYNTDMGSRRGP